MSAPREESSFRDRLLLTKLTETEVYQLKPPCIYLYEKYREPETSLSSGWHIVYKHSLWKTRVSSLGERALIQITLVGAYEVIETFGNRGCNSQQCLHYGRAHIPKEGEPRNKYIKTKNISR